MPAQPPPTSQASVDVGQLRPMLALIENAALPLDRLLAAAGLPAGFFDQPAETPARLADYFRLSEQIALMMGDETNHVSLRPLMLGTSDFVRERLRSAATVNEMLETLAGSYNVIHGDRYNHVRQARGELAFVVDDADFPYALDRDDPFILFSLEALLVYVHILLQSSSRKGGPLPLRSVRTRRRGHGGLFGGWGVPVVPGARHFALHYDAAAGDLPVDPADCPVLGARTVYGGIARALDAMETPAACPTDIVRRVGEALLDGLQDQHAVARRLGMSVASLRRRLAERGTSFRAVRHDTLRSLAATRLESGHPVAAIAEELGFSDGRSFARAFRGWTGQSPREYRSTISA